MSGREITIRVESGRRRNLYFGFGPAPKGEPRFKIYERPRGGVRSQRESSRGTPMSALRADVTSALVNQGYKRAQAKRMAQGARGDNFSSMFNDAMRRNPTAAAIREDFTGREVDRVGIFSEPHMPKGDYALLGKLLALYVKPAGGGQVQVIHPGSSSRVLVVSDESGRQIWFVGGDQDVSSGLEVFGARQRGEYLFELGQATRLDYKQRKEHVERPEIDEWRHDLGEESGVRPTVLFDLRCKRLLFEGGDYRIESAGIIN